MREKTIATVSAFLLASGKLTPGANICLLLLFFQNQQVVCICWTCSSRVWSHSEHRACISSQDAETRLPPLPVTICVPYLELLLFGEDLWALLQHEPLTRTGPWGNAGSEAPLSKHRHCTMCWSTLYSFHTNKNQFSQGYSFTTFSIVSVNIPGPA